MVREVDAVLTKDTRGIFVHGKVPIRDCGDDDVEIDIHWAGICHSDYHAAKAEWGGPKVYPMVPGHEIAGIVAEVGKNVTKFKVGNKVGVGCMIDSCRECESCKSGDENYCAAGNFVTYNALLDEKYQKEKGFPTNTTYGGYSQKIVVNEDFVLKVPDSLPLHAAAPILCAGITTYSPLVYFGAKKAGKDFHVGILGLGGLGDMAAKLSKQMGNQVSVISSSERKKEYVEKTLGVKFLNAGKTPESLNALVAKHAGSFDLILCTLPRIDDVHPYISLIKNDATLCLLGAPADNISLNAFPIISGRKRIVGSLIGGIKETQEVLDFCAEHKIWSEVEQIRADEVNRAYTEMGTGSAAKQRFVIDVKGTLVPGDWEVDSSTVEKSSKHKVSAYAQIIGAPNTAGKTYDPKTDKFTDGAKKSIFPWRN